MRRLAYLCALWCFTTTAAQAQTLPTAHPLDPLSAVEIQQTIKILAASGRLPADSLFPQVTLHESKTDVLASKPGAPFSRAASVVVFARKEGHTYEAIVDLRARSVKAWTERPGVQPSIIIEEFDLVPEIVRANPDWQAAMRKRGTTEPVYWHLVAPYVAAPHHQHFFNFRLDVDIDRAEGNVVTEINVKPAPADESNPLRNAFLMEETILRNEKAAQRSLDLATNRRWGVFNPSATNALGQPGGYLLVPGDNSVPYLGEDSPVRRRAGFINHHFWATQFNPDEMHAAGEYPNQSAPGESLPKWTAADRSLDRQDVVVWYTFAPTHIPRPEEWPVMTAGKVGFKLVPVSFFSKNPALDVPRPRR